MNTYPVRFNKVSLVGNELQYMSDCVNQGTVSTKGHWLLHEKCDLLLERFLGVPRAMLTASCTHALEMAALLDIQPRDEVIVPNYQISRVPVAMQLLARIVGLGRGQELCGSDPFGVINLPSGF
jgi:dTDP-4-amino-4,6-dideoxygalactose transaminase